MSPAAAAELADGADGWAPAYCISKTAHERRHLTIGRRAAEVRDQLRLSGLGPHRYGRPRRDEVGCGGGLRDSLVS